MKTLEFIEKYIGKSLAQLLMKLLDVLQKVSELFLSWHKAKLSNQKKQEQKQKEDMIDDIASNGTIADLLDMSRWEKTR